MKYFVQCLLTTFSFAVVAILIGVISKDFTFETIPFSEILYSTLIFSLGYIAATLINVIYRKVKSRKKLIKSIHLFRRITD
ncbi:hypothetical protein A5871_000755 [Enterococcus sp. 2F9_DIV0599]|nr:hypothetical protein A5870_000644 [Enterococcus sp. 2G9_DIV0600]OTO36217.1 hypothetical protein A5871_000755 [Enterococcus sp. 2F9_DIV0599]